MWVSVSLWMRLKGALVRTRSVLSNSPKGADKLKVSVGLNLRLASSLRGYDCIKGSFEFVNAKVQADVEVIPPKSS
jgi:hypothetical protein